MHHHRSPLRCLLGAALMCTATAFTVPAKEYGCVGGRCVLGGGGAAATMPFSTCQVMCEKSLWPLPSGDLSVAGAALAVCSGGASFATSSAPHEVLALLSRMQDVFMTATFPPSATAGSADACNRVKVDIAITSNTTDLSLGTPEGYKLTSGGFSAGVLQVSISAETVFGARHALETLSQLLHRVAPSGGFAIPSQFSVVDEPAYPYRGVMLDTSRNFIPVPQILLILRGMGMAKLNSLHLHLTDTASFPVEVSRRINLTLTGAYSDEMVYRVADMNRIAEYAQANGIRVVPEIDQPGHARSGWGWGPAAGLGDLAVCNSDVGQGGGAWGATSVEPPSGQLNPVNPHVQEVLSDIYAQLLEGFGGGGGVFHLGGDEVVVGNEEGSGTSCWNNSAKAASVTNWIEEHGLDRREKSTWIGIWANFTKKSTEGLRGAYANSGKGLQKIMQWAGADGGMNLVASDLRGATFPTDLFMFQVWDGHSSSIAPELMNSGYDVILSNYDLAYLDCGRGSWVGSGAYWCAFVDWKTIYDSVPTALGKWDHSLHKGASEHLKGAELPLWTEAYDASTVMSSLFPRASALGERLWSNPKGSWHDADPRMQVHRQRMVEKGIAAAALQTHWCLQHGSYSCTA